MRVTGDTEVSASLCGVIGKGINTVSSTTRNILAVLFISCAIGVSMWIGRRNLSSPDSYVASDIPVRLVSYSASFDPSPDEEPFVHAHLHGNNLHLVVRTWFYNSAPLAKPFISVDSSGHGTLHINTRQSWQLFSTKCEAFRQFEVATPFSEIHKLSSLQIFNHDTGEMLTPSIDLVNPASLNSLIKKSDSLLTLESLKGSTQGC